MSHPATDASPDRWTFEEEVYSFTSDPRKLGAKLLFSVDPTSYKGAFPFTAYVPAVPDLALASQQRTALSKPKATRTPSVSFIYVPNPARTISSFHQILAWVEDYAAGATIRSGTPGPGVAGRSFYSSLGHLNETWQDPTFMKHVMGGLAWTFGSNTTWVASGLYGGALPTVRTGASNNMTVAAANPWSPVVGSNATAPPPPPPKPTETLGSGSPAATGAGTTGNTSGAASVKIGAGVWAAVLAVAGIFTL